MTSRTRMNEAAGKTTGNLKSRVMQLSNEDLITKEEQNIIISKRNLREMESEIFRLLINKEMKNSIRILKVMKIPLVPQNAVGPGVNTLGNSSGIIPMVPKYTCVERNPMKISGVLHCVFGFLPLKTIKKCRLVCREWNSCAEPFTRKLSRISFGHPKNPSTFTRGISNFDETFRLAQTAIPFTAAELTKFGGNQSPWPEPVLVDFFNTWRHNLNELTIDNIKIKDHPNIYNISELFKFSHLTKLNVECKRTWSPGLKLQIAWKYLTHVKFLNLFGCELFFAEGSKIEPVEVCLKECDFRFPIQDVKKVINNYLEFGKMKKLAIQGYAGNVVLDLGGNIELDTLDVFEMQLLNWGTCNWTIDTFRASGVKLVTKSQVIVKNMEFIKGQMSLAAIPEATERLVINSSYYSTIEVNQIGLTPELRHIKIPPRLLWNFKYCPKLESVELFEDNRSDSISANWLAETVRNVKLNGRLNFIGGELKELDKLVFHRCAADHYDTVTRTLKCQNLVLEVPRVHRSLLMINDKYLEIINGPYHSVAIGPMKWESSLVPFENSSISKLVNKKSEFYLFKNGRGKAIERSDFFKMAQF